jgi:hypothetical protein
VLSGQSDRSVLSWQTRRGLRGSRTQGGLAPQAAPLLVAGTGLVALAAYVGYRRARADS